MSETLPKRYILKQQKDFKFVFGGLRLESESFIIYKRNNEYKFSRFGIVTSKKFGNAVERNYIRRIIKEFIRKMIDKNVTKDFIIIPKKNKKFNVLELEKVLK